MKSISSFLGVATLSMITALLFAGCMLGPDHATPAMKNLPSSFLQGTLTNGASENLTRDWWKSFNDPMLVKVLEEGDASNLSILQAIQRIEQSRAALRQSGAAFWPTVNASGSASKAKNWNPDETKSSYNAGIDASWQLDLFGANRRSAEAAAAELESAGYALEDARLSLSAEIADAYFNFRLLQSNLDIAVSNLDIQTKSAQIAKAKGEGGLTSGLDVISAEAQIETTKAEIPTLQAQIAAQMYAIELLLGRYPGELKDRLSVHAPVPQTALVPALAPAELLKRRPDIRKADADLHAATARVGAAEADRFPSIMIGGSASLSASSLSSWSEAVRSAGITPSISVPLFAGGKLKARVAQYRAAAEESLLAYTETVLSAVSEVETAWVTLEREQAREESLERALKHNRDSVDTAIRQYENGDIDYLNVLSYQKSYLAAQQALEQHRTTLAIQSVKLFKALGGPVAE